MKTATVIQRIVLDFPACVRWIWEFNSKQWGSTDCQQATDEQEDGQSREKKGVEEDKHGYGYNLLGP